MLVKIYMISIIDKRWAEVIFDKAIKLQMRRYVGDIMESEDTKFIERLELIKGNDSVRSFAKKCGINEGTMLRYFNGSLPSISNAYMIAKACDVSLTWLASYNFV